MDFSKILDAQTGTITFPREWRDDPESDWLKFVDPELRKHGGSPSKFMASALKNMPHDHPQRDEVQHLFDRIIDLQTEKIKEQLGKDKMCAQQFGMTLTIVGLKSNPEHNGKKVYLAEWVPEKERWRCKLPSGEYIGVRPRNLA